MIVKRIPMLLLITSVFSFSIEGIYAADSTANIPELIQGLKGWNRAATEANYEKLYQIGKPAVPYLIKVLKDEDPGLRSQAARLLGDLQAEEAVIPLGELINDPKSWVTRSAVFSLGNIGSPAAIPILKKALKHYKPKVQEAALISLDELQDKSILPDITELMISANDQYVRWQAMMVIRSIEKGSEISALIKTLDDKKAKVTSRRNSAVMLGELKAESAIPSLIKAFSDKDAGIRWGAVEAVGKMGAIQARPKVEELLKDKDLDVRMFAIGALGRLGSKDSVPALSRMLSSKPSEVRKNAIRSLGRIGGNEAAKAIREKLADSDRYVKVLAIETLVNLNDTDSAAEIKLLASDRSPSVRTVVMSALGRLGGDSALDVLRAGTEDKNFWVKGEAERSLKKLQQ